MLRRALALALAALVVVPAVPAQAAPAPIDLVGLDFHVINAGSRWCLTSELTELPCAPTDPYRWRFRPAGVAGTLELLSVKTGRCLSMPGGTRVEGARAGLEPCAATPARRWVLRDSTGETAKLVNTNSEKCLRIESGVAVQGSCAGTAGSRRWTVRVLSMPIPGLA
ncbi:RICIN domain-containing protein [Paractinoplanes maris]|uniref:RICIN domain-containing protein n=1 Tax=Paractinoplanes maris TaxID=1734446 RepID=UPI00202257C5|nr:RICIN domain-containing protein [Actinoplanes maris]